MINYNRINDIKYTSVIRFLDNIFLNFIFLYSSSFVSFLFFSFLELKRDNGFKVCEHERPTYFITKKIVSSQYKAEMKKKNLKD